MESTFGDVGVLDDRSSEGWRLEAGGWRERRWRVVGRCPASVRPGSHPLSLRRHRLAFPSAFPSAFPTVHKAVQGSSQGPPPPMSAISSKYRVRRSGEGTRASLPDDRLLRIHICYKRSLAKDEPVLHFTFLPHEFCTGSAGNAGDKRERRGEKIQCRTHERQLAAS